MGIDPQGPIEVGEGLVVLPLLRPDMAPAGEGLGVARAEADRLVEVGDRPLELLLDLPGMSAPENAGAACGSRWMASSKSAIARSTSCLPSQASPRAEVGRGLRFQANDLAVVIHHEAELSSDSPARTRASHTKTHHRDANQCRAVKKGMACSTGTNWPTAPEPAAPPPLRLEPEPAGPRRAPRDRSRTSRRSPARPRRPPADGEVVVLLHDPLADPVAGRRLIAPRDHRHDEGQADSQKCDGIPNSNRAGLPPQSSTNPALARSSLSCDRRP